MPRTLRTYHVVPRLPGPLSKLRDIAQNLWWAWAADARTLFWRIDPVLWEKVHGNPIELLTVIEQKRLDELATDDAFLAQVDAAYESLQKYLSREGWFAKKFPECANARIAYFSMEYGLHESLPVYSGGLGVLAGDHLKTASDLGLPLVGIGLAYAEGYFRQALNSDGLQQEKYPINDWRRLPVIPVVDASGKRLVIDVAYPERTVFAQLWRVQVGRVPLYLLDSNVIENAPDDRSITGPLYGGDQEFRVRQEIMLGIGGVHALEALGLTPTVCHMNEGHSAFLSIERIGRLIRDRGASFAVAREACTAQNVFTTHTPVPAGNDSFKPELVRKYLEPYRKGLGITDEQLLGLGREDTSAAGANFQMPVLAIRASDHYNGVSELHGRVSRKMWSKLWPDLPEHEVPIQSVTNGVHVASWLSDEMAALLTRYLGPRWAETPDDPELWARTYEIPDAELWQIHEHRRHRLVVGARRWLRNAAERRGEAPEVIEAAEQVLDPRALTIGFARRFATYKRATLLFSDIDRVLRLVSDPKRPVQLVFAGKAHPQDKGGKELIRQIVHESRKEGLVGHVVFIEDYDMRIARALVSGVDVWLNTPRRPLEASGTSGMKAAANGVLNLSVLDGWWAEAWRDHGSGVGWAIGRGEEYENAAGDAIEAELLHHVLEREVVPLFFDRDERDGLPRGWIKKMKNAIAKLAPTFNTARMVREYSERFYVPSHKLWHRMTDAALRGARELVAWKERAQQAWPDVVIEGVVRETSEEVTVGDSVTVTATVRLGALSPEDVVVELYHGETGGALDLTHGDVVRMKVERAEDGGRYHYRGEIPTRASGAHAFAVRVMPWNAAMSNPYETTLVRWG
ncbi:glycosyltransferase family 1 protein [soil metagenome]